MNHEKIQENEEILKACVNLVLTISAIKVLLVDSSNGSNPGMLAHMDYVDVNT